jgi:2-isopropylmalate synthase
MDKVFIFDTTLRDGEQSAGVAFDVDDKIEIAQQLERLGVDIIEAGFPCSSPGDLRAVQEVAKVVKNATICGLARANARDIDICWEGVQKAVDPRIHVFISSSEIHLAHQIRKSRDEVLDLVRSMVGRAAGYTSNVEFSPMDATRSDPEYVIQICQTAIEAGATTINIPDTVGYTIPQEFGSFLASVIGNTPGSHKARWSFHGQNDLGLATANALTAIQNGVRQVEVTINGIGERAGNTSLEEVVMAIKTRQDFFNLRTDINIREIYRTSRLVETLSGMPIQWNKAIVGKNAFRHGSGIHQDGILKMRETFEIMDPNEIGIPTGTQIVLGKLSGRHGFKQRLEELGYELSEEELTRAFAVFKQLADTKDEVDDRDLEAIVADRIRSSGEAWHLESIQVTCGDPATPTASVRLISPSGDSVADAALGTGPVDAVYKAINRIVGEPNRLTEFAVKSVTEGIDAIGEVTIRIEAEGRTFSGRGGDTDIIVASAKAYMNALNRLIAYRQSGQAAAQAPVR